jgi:phosphoribosylformimino-5-aminoimidazole carboxamide ribotide isomerase
VELFPAIDVQGGRVARAPPEPGADDPLASARAFATVGARWVHFVDLDRAFGRGDNRELARRFLAAAAIPVQVGGGLRTDAAVDELLGWGARRVVVGAPAPDAGLVERLLGRYGTERIAVGIDGRDGRVAPRGGSEILDLSPLDLARRVRDQGARTVIYTDAARDGMLSGPDVEGARAIAALGLDVVLSGGVAALDDLRRARSAGLAGVIVGRALHEGRFTLAEALACVA